jgi:hypothetical protein
MFDQKSAFLQAPEHRAGPRQQQNTIPSQGQQVQLYKNVQAVIIRALSRHNIHMFECIILAAINAVSAQW